MIDDEPRAAKMSLRDFFAAMAMQSLVIKYGDAMDDIDLANSAYDMAEFMLTERNAREQEPEA